MLNYNAKGSYTDITGVPWVYYQDDVDKSTFYIVPAPAWVESNGVPEIKLITYTTDGPTSGSGYVTFNTQLIVPPGISAGVEAKAIPTQFPAAKKPYNILPLDYNPGCTAEFTLTVEGTATDYLALAAEFGSNVASFTANLTKAAMSTITGLLTTAGGGLNVRYNLNVPARLNAVTATLGFDSSIAYQYQVTHAQSHAYAADTPRSVQKLLKESSSSTVHLAWGVPNPSQELITTVTNWANDTIGSLVSAEVGKALAILGESSYDTFTINEASSFTSVYATDQVVNWQLYPEASLPAIRDLSSHETKVDKRMQVMSISTNVPFSGDKIKGANIPKVDATPVLVKQLIAKVTYPGLSQANSTHVFTENGTVTFEAPYDERAGNAYDVAWTAEYVGGTMKPVNGNASNITKGSYEISLASVGILHITFEAAASFKTLADGVGTNTPSTVTSIDIDFHFVATHGGGNAIHQKQTIAAPPAKPVTTAATTSAAATKPPDTQAVFSSYVAHNVVTGTKYGYVVTYHFSNGPDFVAPEASGTSFYQLIAMPPAPKPIPVYVIAKLADMTSDGGTQPTVLGVDVGVWFDTVETIPGSDPQPTKQNPTTFSLVPTEKNGVTFARDIFLAYLNGSIPLVYSATITTDSDQIVIQPTRITNRQQSILVNAKTRYATLTILSDEIQWPNPGYDKIILDVTATKTVGSTPESPQTDSLLYIPPVSNAPADPWPRYLTYSYEQGASTLSFNWIATYTLTGGRGTTTASGTATMERPEIVIPAQGTTPIARPPVVPAVAAPS